MLLPDSPPSLIRLTAEIDSLQAALEFARIGAAAAQLPEHCWGHVDLVMEEIFVNVASYAYDEGVVGPVEITSQAPRPGVLMIEIADEGHEYDPLTLRQPNLPASLNERAVGGLGVFLVRQFTETLEYERTGSWNRLRFTISEASTMAATDAPLF